MSKKVLIIGSGIAGIAASLKLKSYGLESTIVDKGSFIGGRIGTREEKVGKKHILFFSRRTIFHSQK
jgi:predicted NAD/FAD-dependent oxidoreductase